jgi:hypothetical protein
MKKQSDFMRVIQHALEFYSGRKSLIFLFSIPFFFAFLIPLLLPSPTYLALGGVFVRGGSIPSMSIFDWTLTALTYLVAIFLIADSMVNIGLIIKAKRTFTNVPYEILNAIGKYATKVFLVLIIFTLLLSALFLVLYENPFQSVLYPLLSFVISMLFFFSVPAIVIDERDTLNSLRASFRVVMQKPLFVLIWLGIAFVFILLSGIIAYVFPRFLTQYVMMLLNSIVILPFLLVLSTQMYMEKYPLAN